jgi:hypothetical protein
MRRLEQPEAVKAGPCFKQLEGRVGRGKEKVGEKRRFRDACDAGGERTGQGLRGEGEKLENKSKKEAKHKQGSFQGQGKEEAVDMRKRPLSEESNETQEQQNEGVGGSCCGGLKSHHNTHHWSTPNIFLEIVDIVPNFSIQFNFLAYRTKQFARGVDDFSLTVG